MGFEGESQSIKMERILKKLKKKRRKKITEEGAQVWEKRQMHLILKVNFRLVCPKLCDPKALLQSLISSGPI